MKRRLTAVLAALLCLPVLASCGDNGGFSDKERLSAEQKRSTDITVTYNYADGAAEPPQNYIPYSDAVTQFSLALFSSLAKENKGSFTCSPVSSALLLSMLANGGSKDTRQEILRAVDGSMSLEDVNACSSYFKSRMESVSRTGKKEAPAEKVTLDGALLADDGVNIKTSFLQVNADFYGYDVFRFVYSDENAAEKLGNYLKSYTSQSGIGTLKSGTINLTGAVSVVDNWLQGDKIEAAKGKFKGEDGERDAVFLTSDESCLQSEKAVGVLKYTSENPLKLLLIEPKEPEKFSEYAAGFDTAELEALLGSLDVTKKQPAVIPEFTIETDGKARALSTALSASGLYTLFSEKAAFSGLSYTQKVRLDEFYEIPPSFSLTRSGINAASDGKTAPDASLKPSKDAVVFDHPFIFMLLDNESGLPVVAGIYR